MLRLRPLLDTVMLSLDSTQSSFQLRTTLLADSIRPSFSNLEESVTPPAALDFEGLDASRGRVEFMLGPYRLAVRLKRSSVQLRAIWRF